MQDDIAFEDVIAAVGIFLGGDREGGRHALMALWDKDPAAAMRCVLAHYIADAQGDAEEELRWDLLALQAADEAMREGDRLLMPGVQVSAFYPSLYLNVADASLRSGDIAAARSAYDAGAGVLSALPDNGYGATVRDAFARLAQRLDAAGGATG